MTFIAAAKIANPEPYASGVTLATEGTRGMLASIESGGTMIKRSLMAGALLFAAAAPILAQDTAIRREPRVLSVNGMGIVQRQPDRAVVLVAVESRANTAQAAAAANARKMDAVYAALRKMGIVPPKVSTISYELQPQYSQPSERRAEPFVPQIVGYVAINMVRVETDSVQRAGAIIDAVIPAGANRIANLSFELRDPEAARLEALKIAVQKARTEAEVVATAAGQRLGQPQSISSSSGYQPMYRRMEMAQDMAVAAPSAPTPIEAGSLTVTANVNIVYLLEDR